jgi:hypothetical protein
MTQAELPPLSEWKTVHMRLTAFPNPEDSFDGEEWWAEITGYAPDTKTEQPKTSEKIHRGAFEGGSLALSLFPSRINWVYSATSEQILKTENIPVLGTFEERVQTFEQVMKGWLQIKSPSLARLAFGAQVIQSVSSHDEAYNRLSNYLPFDIDASNSSDFLYRINKKRNALSMEGLEINRLSTWSALRFEGNIQSTATPRQNRAIERYACLLELDINTSADYAGDLKQAILSDLFSELIALGLEIAKEGDIS